MVKKSTKGALLTSSVALLVCFTMLIGTTFAWFTDSVTSANNIIKSGNLDVEFEYLSGTEWKSVNGEANILTNTLWEPGVTEVAYLRVSNAGSLALKYQLGINIVSETAGINVAGTEFKLSDYLYFGVVEKNGETDAFANRAAAVAAVTNSQKISAGYTKEAEMAAGDDQYFALVVYMPETVANEANHNGSDIPQINLGLNVFATQLSAEDDSFDNTYDGTTVLPDVAVNNAAELAAAIANAEAGDVITLASDITGVDADTAINVASGANVTLDLNGYEISATADKTGNQELFLVKGNMTVKNGSLELTAQNNQGWNSMATLFDVTAGGALTLENVTAGVSGTDMNFSVHLNNWGTASVTINNCEFYNSYVAVRAFNSGNDMNNVTIKNSTVHGGRLFWVHNYTAEGKNDSTLNLNIYNNGNSADNAKPIRFGFSDSLYYDLNGNQIL